MAPLGKGRLAWLLVLLVAPLDFQWTRAHPVGEPQLDEASDVLPSSGPSSIDTPSYDYIPLEGEADYELYPDLLQPNDTGAVDSRGGNEFLEMDPNMLGDVLEFLEVESLDQYDPALENPGGLQVMTQGGDHLKVTRGQDGSISINGSVVDGVMSLPDGTEIYTLERFLAEHRHLMDEAFRHLATQSKSLEQNNGRNFVTKPQPKGTEGIEAEEKLEVLDQISRPASPDVETPMLFSVSVSEVTEISTRTSPPEMTVQKSIHAQTVTEVPNEALSPEGHMNLETNQTDFSADRFPDDEVYHEELGPDYLAYEDTVHGEEFPEATTQNDGISDYPLYEDAFYSEAVTEGALKGQEIPEYPVPEEADYEDVVTDETISHSTAVSEGNVSTKVPVVEVLIQESHLEVVPVTQLPLETESHQPEVLTEDVKREGKEIVSETDLNQISVSGDKVEKINVLEDVTEIVPIPTTMPVLESDLNEEDLVPVTEPVRIHALVPVPVLNEEEPAPFTEGEEESITTVSETDPTDIDSPVTEYFFEAEDPLPVTELGPFPSKVALKHEEQSHANQTSVVQADQEPAVTSGQEILDDTQFGGDILSEASIDSPVQIEHPHFTALILNAPTEQTRLPNSLLTSELVKDDGVSKLTLPRHTDTQTSEGILDVASEDQENSTFIVPAIPPVVSEMDILPIVDVWGFSLLEQENDTKINLEVIRAPKTILTPEFHEFVNVVPQDSWHPLYASTPESKTLRKEFVMDYLLEEPILPQDQRIASPEGLSVSNIGGKELSFKRDSEGYFSINGIPVLDFSILSDGTVTYTLATFLFDHRALVKEALLRHSRVKLPDLTTDAPGPPLDIVDVPEVLPIEPTVQAVTETLSTGVLPPSEEFPVTEAIGSSPISVPEIQPSLVNESSLLDTGDHVEPTDQGVTGTEELPAPPTAQPQDDLSEDSYLIQKTLPVVPETVIMGRHSSLLQFWQLSLEDQERLSVPVNEVVPKTLLNPDILVVESLVPEGFEHPLLSNKTENEALRTEIVLDYLIPQSVNLQDLKTAPAGGLHVTNFNGKDLVFEGKFGSGQSRLTVNGVDVTKIVTLADGTHVFELTDLLFDHRQRISELTRRDQEKSNRQGLPEPTVTDDDGLQEPGLSVPPIPLPAAINPTASQTHLWAYNQFYQDKYRHVEDARLPKTILSPEAKKMEALVPNDDRHPLYENNSQRYVDLRTKFLLNYLILESVDEKDVRITQPEGFTVKNLLGKNITFAKDDQGNLKINGFLVEKVDTLDDDMKVYHLSDFLFDHSELQAISDEYKTSNAVNSSIQQTAEVSASSVDEVLVDDSPVKEAVIESEAAASESEVEAGRNQSLNYVPGIPEFIEDSGLSLINLWRYSLRHQDLSFLIAERKIPMTVISPINDKMQNMVPEDSPHPLYDDSPESVALRTEFLLDYLALDRISPNDTRISEHDGLKVLNLNQRELWFSTDVDGNLMISGVPVEDVETLPDGTHIYTLSDFLFDHKFLVNEALRKLSARMKITEAPHTGAVNQTDSQSPEGQV
ncbi:uncharacterized protein [Macrobrachium rosenbergii]|uniref:uncharacterized protein isoform X2 n=1 Tax=Macrobrachium rosenbergii TaxID=79674 RepID=UPI0034D6025F